MTDQTSRTAASAAQAEVDAALSQVSVYLLRNVDDWADALRTTSNVDRLELDAGTGLSGAVYVARRTVRPPRWLPFVRAITGADLQSHAARRLSAVLFLEQEEHQFAITFGYGRHLLDHDRVRSDFGLKVAAGLVDPDDIAGADARSAQASSVQVRRNSSRPSAIATIGFDPRREILRAITGRVLDPDLGTRISGSDSVALTRELDVESLGETLKLLLAAYSEERYLEHFRHIGRWEIVTEPQLREQLDGELVAALIYSEARARSDSLASDLPGGARPHLEAPVVIDWRVSGFRTNIEAARTVHAFPDLEAYLSTLGRPPRLRDLTKNHRLELISDESDDVVESWPLYSALNWELDFDHDFYLFAEGKWWRVDAQYRQQIDDLIADIPQAQLARPDFDPLEWEIDYNERLAAQSSDRAMLDHTQVRFDDESGTVEPCDVFTGQRQFVHVKKDDGAADLSHLFMQAAASAELFARSNEFRIQLRGLVSGAGLEALVPQGRPETNSYEVVLAIISNADDPIASSLPFLARHSLAQVRSDIEGHGFRLSQARIPVRTGARPADAGPLYRVRHPADRAKPKRKRTRTRLTPLPAETDTTAAHT